MVAQAVAAEYAVNESEEHEIRAIESSCVGPNCGSFVDLYFPHSCTRIKHLMNVKCATMDPY